MSQEQYYSDVKIIKKPFNTRIKLLLKIFFVIAIVLGCFVGAKYISSALTVGNISNLIVFGSTSIKTNESVMYAVALGVYDNYDDAMKIRDYLESIGWDYELWLNKKNYIKEDILGHA